MSPTQQLLRQAIEQLDMDDPGLTVTEHNQFRTILAACALARDGQRDKAARLLSSEDEVQHLLTEASSIMGRG